MADLLVPYIDLKNKLQDALMQHGFDEERAELCARLFAETDLDGVRSHGIERFGRFLDYIHRGVVRPDAKPTLLSQSVVFERWDGNQGPGNLNANFCMDRAISLASSVGVGMVGLAHTNHWMRGGSYAWQAIAQGKIGICFTNTTANMPAWGSKEPKLGNNPLVIGIPHPTKPIVLDMAMSQFAYGKLSLLAAQGKEADFPVGFDQRGQMTKEPGTVLENNLALPAGLWKGAGLSLMLDLLGTLLSGGKSTHEIGKEPVETSLSQVFIALDPQALGLASKMDARIEAILKDYLGAAVFEGKRVTYPGQKTLETRINNLKNGVPVSQKTWENLLQTIR